jgi:hypothetical protein
MVEDLGDAGDLGEGGLSNAPLETELWPHFLVNRRRFERRQRDRQLQSRNSTTSKVGNPEFHRSRLAGDSRNIPPACAVNRLPAGSYTQAIGSYIEREREQDSTAMTA